MEKPAGNNYGTGLHRLPPGMEWRFIGGFWYRCRKKSARRLARIEEQRVQVEAGRENREKRAKSKVQA